MSNRKRARNRRLIAQQAFNREAEEALGKPEEKEVVGNTAAVIKWKDVPGIDREDEELVGEAIVYIDDTSDLILFSDISDDAKLLFKEGLGAFIKGKN